MGTTMGKYLVCGSYSAEGAAALMKDGGTPRVAVAEAAAASVGGTVESMYFAFGDVDIYAICDLPDNASATALSLTINSSGTVAVTVTPLLTPEDVDAAAAITPSY